MLFSRFLAVLLRFLPYRSRFTLLDSVWKAVDQEPDVSLRWLTRKRIFDSCYTTWSVQPSDAQVRNYGFFQLVSQITSVPGEIVECGVGRGSSLVTLCYAAAFFKLEKAVYGFDSFAGFPNASNNDLSARVTTTGRVSGWTETSPEMILKILETDRVHNPRTFLRERVVRPKLIAGFFNQSLATNLPKRIAFLHVDCDLYDSTRDVLSLCLPRMSPGGIVILDEYDDVAWPGAKKATDETCAAYGLTVKYFAAANRYGIELPFIPVEA